MTEYLSIDATDGYELYLSTGTLPGDAGALAAGHEPNGYFWESLLAYLVRTRAPKLADRYDPDSEAGTFIVLTDSRKVAQKLRDLIEPYLGDATLTEAAVAEATAAGFTFDD